MSPDEIYRNEIYRAMSDYVVMPEPPSVDDMLVVPAADALFDLSPTDMVQHYHTCPCRAITWFPNINLINE